MPRDVGFSDCIVCSARVMIREDANRRAYFKCNGHYDAGRKACGAEVKFGGLDSATLIAQLDEQAKNVIHDQENAGPRAQPRKTGGSDADGRTDPAPQPRSKSGGIFDFG